MTITCWGRSFTRPSESRDLRVITDDKRYFDFTKAGFEFEKDEPGCETGRTPARRAGIHRGRCIGRSQLPRSQSASSEGQCGIRQTVLIRLAARFSRSRIGTPSREYPRHLLRSTAGHQRRTAGMEPDASRLKPLQANHRFLFVERFVGAGRCSCGRESATATSSPTQDNKIALWFGGIDDLWKFGKPIGDGGPWLNTEVKANVPSDPYLMTGYDMKTAHMSHQSDDAGFVHASSRHRRLWALGRLSNVQRHARTSHVARVSRGILGLLDTCRL